MKILKNKKAISPVVATILVVLITIAAVTIVWSAVIPLIRDNTSLIGGGGIPELYIVTSEGYTTYNPSEGLASVQVQRGDSEEGDSLVKVQVLFEIQGETTAYEVPAPNANGVRTYYFNLVSQPDKVSIAPIVTKGNDEEALSVVSEAEFEEGIMARTSLPEGTMVYDPVGAEYVYIWQYQEDSDETLVTNSGSWVGLSNIYDGVWDSSLGYYYTAGSGYINLNYTKPTGSKSAIWQVKTYPASTNNYSITSDCWNYDSDKLILRLESLLMFSNIGTAQWYCYDGSWHTVGSTITASMNMSFYEEAVYWNVSSIV